MKKEYVGVLFSFLIAAVLTGYGRIPICSGDTGRLSAGEIAPHHSLFCQRRGLDGGRLFVLERPGDRPIPLGSENLNLAVDTVIVELFLGSVSDTPIFNQNHVPDYYLEYGWSIYVDSDSNPSTGDFDGFDVQIGLLNFKFPGSLPFNGSILDVGDKCTWILDGDMGYYGHPIDACIDTLDRSLLIIAPRAWSEMANVDGLDRFYFTTYYWPPSGVEIDYTEESSGTNYVSDPQGDVPYSFIDILGGSLHVTVTGTSEDAVRDVPQMFALSQNYPNPFSFSTAISFSLPREVLTTVTIHDVCGRRIATLIERNLPAGIYTLDWEANVPSGTYLCRLQAGDFTDVKTMILLR